MRQTVRKGVVIVSIAFSGLAGVAICAEPPANTAPAAAPPQPAADTSGLWLVPNPAAESEADFVARLQKDAAAGNTKAQATLGSCYQAARGIPRDLVKAAHWYELAAKAGHPGAQTNLGQLYELGTGVPQDVARAHELFVAAAEQGLPEAEFQVGMDYAYGRGVPRDWREARTAYEKAAAQGNLKAMAGLGNLYLLGSGVPVDLNTARKYFQKPADAGLPEAQFGLAGTHLAQNNFTEAAPWLRLAAEGGNPGAEFYWAVCLYYGRGVTGDLPLALSWARKAVQTVPPANSKMAAQAHALLARIVLDQPSETKTSGAEAFREASIAARTGDREGEYALGLCYMKGAGVAKDLAAAVHWYTAAARQKEPTAAGALGSLFENGTGVARDPAEAFRWYKIGADGGNAAAQYNLARCYRDGSGADVNLDEAAKWMRLAAQASPGNSEISGALTQLDGQAQAQHGDAEAAYRRGVSLMQAARQAGGPKDEGIKALAEASAHGHVPATIMLSGLYRRGDAVPKDEERADVLIAKVKDTTNPAELFQIGLSYMPGASQSPVEKDIDHAIGFLQRAVEHGYSPATGPLGFCYMTASAPHQDFVAAFEWLSVAVSQGDQNARMYLERLRPRLTQEQTQEGLRRFSELRPRNGTSIPIGPGTTATHPWNP